MATQYNNFNHLPACKPTDYYAVLQRLDTIWQAATRQQLYDGLTWYADRHSFLQGVAELTGIPVILLAHACSALSPRTRWGLNERALLDHVGAFMGDGHCPRTSTLYGANDTKAWRILHTGDVTHIGKGLKTINFAENLQEKAGVTVDTVYHQAATGMIPGNISEKVYALLVRATEELARKYGVLPYQFQAVVWVTYRNNAL